MSNAVRPDESAVREAAYFLWLENGQPQGQDQDHWLQAMADLTAKNAKKAKAPAKPRKAAAKKAAAPKAKTAAKAKKPAARKTAKAKA